MSAEQKERVVAPAAPPRRDVDLARRIGLTSLILSSSGIRLREKN